MFTSPVKGLTEKESFLNERNCCFQLPLGRLSSVPSSHYQSLSSIFYLSPAAWARRSYLLYIAGMSFFYLTRCELRQAARWAIRTD